MCCSSHMSARSQESLQNCCWFQRFFIKYYVSMSFQFKLLKVYKEQNFGFIVQMGECESINLHLVNSWLNKEAVAVTTMVTMMMVTMIHQTLVSPLWASQRSNTLALCVYIRKSAETRLNLWGFIIYLCNQSLHSDPKRRSAGLDSQQDPEQTNTFWF